MQIVFFIAGLFTGIVLGLSLGILLVFRKLELPEAKQFFDKITPKMPGSSGYYEPVTPEEEKKTSEWSEFNNQLET